MYLPSSMFLHRACKKKNTPRTFRATVSDFEGNVVYAVLMYSTVFFFFCGARRAENQSCGGGSERSEGGGKKNAFTCLSSLQVYFAVEASSPPAVSCVCPFVAISTVSRTPAPSELWQFLPLGSDIPPFLFSHFFILMPPIYRSPLCHLSIFCSSSLYTFLSSPLQWFTFIHLQSLRSFSPYFCPYICQYSWFKFILWSTLKDLLWVLLFVPHPLLRFTLSKTDGCVSAANTISSKGSTAGEQRKSLSEWEFNIHVTRSSQTENVWMKICRHMDWSSIRIYKDSFPPKNWKYYYQLQ